MLGSLLKTPLQGFGRVTLEQLHRADAEVGDLVTRLSDVGRVALGPLQARIEARHAEFDLAGKIYLFRKTRTVYKREES